MEIQHSPTRDEMIEYASTIGITLSTGSALETWATVLLSYLCNKYAGKSRTVFTGVLNRNTLATYKVLIYDTSKTSGTYNLPQYSIGSIQEYANLKLDFGTETHTFIAYEQTIGAGVTIPRTLSINNGNATFNYTFPADGYLCIRNENSLPSVPLIDDTLNVSGMRLAVSYKVSNTDSNISNLTLFVKKGMTLKGNLYINMPSMLSKITTTFFPIK